MKRDFVNALSETFKLPWFVLAVAILDLVFMILFGGQPAFGQTPSAASCYEERPEVLPPVSCIRIGVSYSVADGKSFETPIYAIMIGDSLQAERLAFNWSEHFGPWSLDAALYVHPADKPAGTWKKAVYRRPKNIDEVKRWFENKEAFYEDVYGGVSLLPEPFRSLAAEELAKVSSVIAYLDGTAKVYLKDGMSAKDAEALLAAMIAKMPAGNLPVKIPKRGGPTI